MNAASRSAKSAFYRDFYDLIPLFTSYTARPAIPRRIIRASPISFARTISTTRCQHLHQESPVSRDRSHPLEAVSHTSRDLPRSCPGCGAPTQTINTGDAGFYTPERNAVRKYLNPGQEPLKEELVEDAVFKAAMENAPEALREQLGLEILKKPRGMTTRSKDEPATPICDRCHHLINHHSGIPINHPSLDAIEATIGESPHKYNHIYHVIDAADFPMSLVSNLHHRLDHGWLRGRNRRAKNQHFSGGQSGEMSFIITRSDLLAPNKEQVDTLMPQMREILRDCLGKHGEDKRLGNVRLVSSKRGWWTKEVKESIWERGGGGWLVGKANVGKSNLFEVVFPKGTMEDTPNMKRLRELASKQGVEAALASSGDSKPLIDDENQIGTPNFESSDISNIGEDIDLTQAFTDTSSLLPPAQPETNYPVMPIISSLPGTTASPIRVPFGNGRGELIDLPGLDRLTLEPYIKPENRLDIVMKRRVTPERHVIKPGSSLVLGGGLIRITPKTPDLVFMVHAFVPMSVHITSTQKAEALGKGERDLDIPSIVHDDKKGSVKKAAAFRLETDVTKKHAGPLVRKDAAGLKTSKLPFVVWATDILVEGCGWIEIVAQVRKPKLRLAEPEVRQAEGEFAVEGSSGKSHLPLRFTNIPERKRQLTGGREKEPRNPLELSEAELATTMPEIEVFSPEGKFIGQRPSLSCWLLHEVTEDKAAKKVGRPRRSMKGAKKLEKTRRRA